MNKKFFNILFIFTVTGAGAPLLAQVTYRISPPGTVQISGTSTVSDWTVRSEEIKGDMVFFPSEKKPKANELQTGIIKNAKAVLEVSAIKSEKGETMDNKMYNALKKDAHPRIVFSLSDPIEIDKAPSKFSVRGNVELAGVTRPMTFDLNLTNANNNFIFEGSGSLKLSDFQIEPPTAMFGQIETGDEVMVKLNLVFVK
jgi:hypothetical protein